MIARAARLTALIFFIAAVFVAPSNARSSGHPQIGLYKASTSAGTSFEFRVVKATCPPPVRGGAQHQKKGYCLLPVSEPTVNVTCPSGFVYNGEIYALFEELLSASGALSEPETSSSGTTGSFHIAVDKHGHATGYFELLVLHNPNPEGTSETLEKCPTGRIAFTASRL